MSGRNKHSIKMIQMIGWMPSKQTSLKYFVSLTLSNIFLLQSRSGDMLTLALMLGIRRDCLPGLDIGYLQKSEIIFGLTLCELFSLKSIRDIAWNTRKAFILCLFASHPSSYYLLGFWRNVFTGIFPPASHFLSQVKISYFTPSNTGV